MKLTEFLEETKQKPSRFAARLGVSRQAVDRYCAGARVPRPKVMQKIVVASGGRVTPADFYPTATAKQARAKPNQKEAR